MISRLGVFISLLVGAGIGGALSMVFLKADAPAAKLAAAISAPKAIAPAAKAPQPMPAVDAKLALVIVALCDNQHQGIVPVPEAIGRGDDPDNNLYWGAAYGLRTMLKKPDSGWRLQAQEKPESGPVLERLRLTHSSGRRLVCEAWRGDSMSGAIGEFYQRLSGAQGLGEERPGLVIFCGHNGLMDAAVAVPKQVGPGIGAAVFCCQSQAYFDAPLLALNARPLALTTNFMAPEGYVPLALLGAWCRQSSAAARHEALAAAYAKYQRCSLAAARRLFQCQE